MDWLKIVGGILEAVGQLLLGHANNDDEARHQAVLKLNRLTADAIAQRVL